MKKSYVSTIHRYLAALLVLTIFLVGLIWIIRDFRDLRRGITEHKIEYDRFCRAVLVDQLNRAVDYIRFQQNIERDKIEDELISRIAEAENVISFVRKDNSDKQVSQEDKNKIFEILGAMRWNGGRGYYFVIGKDCRLLVNPTDESGTRITDLKDSDGNLFVRKLLDELAASSTKETFVSYFWNKPNDIDNTRSFIKLAYVKYFEAIGCYIATSKYLDEVSDNSREIMKRRLASVRFSGGDGYIYVIDGTGKMLVHDLRADLLGRNVMDIEDTSGRKFIPELMEVARNAPDGDFVEYQWVKPSTGQPEKKVVFVKYLPDLDWYIASGFYYDDFSAAVRHQAEAMKAGFVVKGISLAVILLMLTLFAYYASKRVVRMTLKDFSLLSSVFSSAASRAQPIDLAGLQFSEFDELAVSANRMIQVRRQAEDALQAYQDSLEETISRRTADLARTNRELLSEINERKRAEDALHESQDLLSSTIHSLDGQLLVLDRELRIVLRNHKGQQMLDELTIGPDDKCYNVFHCTERPCKDCPALLTFEDAQSRVLEKYDEKTGEYSEIRTTPIIRADGSVPLVIEYTYDITERKKSETELLRLRKLLSNIIDSMPSVLVGIDLEGRITQWNLEAARRTGFSENEAGGRRLVELLPDFGQEIDAIMRAIRKRDTLHQEKVVRVVDGQTRFEDITVYPLMADGVQGAVIRIDDVTRRVNMEDLMIQSAKMLSVGGLAAGMAHEINNPLAGMLQNVQVIGNRLRPGLVKNDDAASRCGTSMEAVAGYTKMRGVNDMLEAIMSSGKRAAQIVENMLSFSRKSDSRMCGCDICALLDRTIELAFNDYNLKKKYDFRKIKFERDYAGQMPEVPCDGGMIQQVFLNILKNAAHAMTDGTQREKPCIRLSVCVVDDCVQIKIADNGPGMDEKTCKRIFEPFFTTKSVGVGTGLGLSVSYFIITERHGGELVVESVPDEGTTFIIRLPLERPENDEE